MDPFYPLRKLRHRFAGTVREADDNIGKATFGTFSIVGGTTLLALMGSLALEDIPSGEVRPDKDMAVNAMDVEQSLSNQISDLAEQRQAFLAVQDENSLLSNEALQSQNERGNALKTEMESLASRIVMTDALSETQAAELLEEFSDEVGSIENLGFVESDFGHLRESRDALKADVATDWNQIAKQITHLAAEEDHNDQTYPFQFYPDKNQDGSEIGTGEKVMTSFMLSALAGMSGTLGGLMFVLFSMMLADTRKIRDWAREEPKVKPRRSPYSGH